MKCYVCGMDHVSREDGECPDCGFQLASMSGAESLQEYEAAVKEMAEEYRELYREAVTVGLVVYSYKEDEAGENLVIDQTEEIPLLGTESSVGKILWYPEAFARIEAGEKVSLTLSVEKPRAGKIEKQAEFTAPDWGSVFWKIGILEKEQLSFTLILAADENPGGGSKELSEYEDLEELKKLGARFQQTELISMV